MQTHNSCPSTDGEKNRIYELDMLRGVAALIVAIFHTPHLFSGLAIPHGYLAVDVFFILSGYVMTHSYRSKILNGMSFRTFFVIRWARLYPLYLFSLIVAIAYYLLRLFLEKKTSGISLPGQQYFHAALPSRCSFPSEQSGLVNILGDIRQRCLVFPAGLQGARRGRYLHTECDCLHAHRLRPECMGWWIRFKQSPPRIGARAVWFLLRRAYLRFGKIR